MPESAARFAIMNNTKQPVKTRFKSSSHIGHAGNRKVDLSITYCQPCGHQPRAVELVNQLLSSYGMPLNKRLSIALKPSDGGIFDIMLDGKLIFSRKQEGRFPTVEEIKKQIEPALAIPLEVQSTVQQ